jgi:thiamine kinase-like enzyme
MDLVRAYTDIPVPRVRRVIEYLHSEGDILIVMDFIPDAKQLHVCWSGLSFWKKLEIILTMRYYIRQLRRARHPCSATPGPPGTQPSVCYGLQFGYDPKGPFATTTALAGYFHRLHHFAERRDLKKGYTPLPPLNESLFSHLVFTHNDLNMRNILLDGEGRLWIIDWGFAGFFPPCFEYLAMRYAAQKDKEPKGWQGAIKFMAEPSFEMERWMAKMGHDYAH